jgi:hypothetical protein
MTLGGPGLERLCLGQGPSPGCLLLKVNAPHVYVMARAVVPAAAEPDAELHTLESVYASLTGPAAPDITEQRPGGQGGEVNVGSSGEEGTAEEEAQLEQERLELEVSLLIRNTSEFPRSLPAATRSHWERVAC